MNAMITEPAATALDDEQAPQPMSRAEQIALRLQQELALLNIPAHVNTSVGHATISLWPRLVARCDGTRIWWRTPHESARGEHLWTFALTVPRAAGRLAALYQEIQPRTPAALAELARFAAQL